MLLQATVTDLTPLLGTKEVTIIGVFLVFIVLLILDRQRLIKDLKDKENKIMEVIKEHQNDLKDYNKDTGEMINKYHSFVQQLKDIYNGKL